MENKICPPFKLKLSTHGKSYSKENLLISNKELGFKIGDIIEIYNLEEDEKQPRLLLQILCSDDDLTRPKDTISIDTNIASTFQLKFLRDVIVNKVDPKSVALDLLELTFKDQYLGRSDMWRLKRDLANSVVYLNRKIEFCSGLIRCQVYEMWAHGEKVACGVVSEDTKIVFRSSTCQAYLFIQMSSEMWEYDMYGDLYFEKAVNGFLAELFTKWKQEGSNHDVTIVLFSRTYYKTSAIEEFPVFMRECIQVDYQGRFYEDFYRVAVQNERFDDWTTILRILRELFHNYLDDVLWHHHSSEFNIPEAYNSNAAQGNFLEVLNISLNVFEKHYMDRSFERTGQMSVVITPGVGVFEVDRELTNITKQRIIDNGVGSDLVCVGEQPLHAVPLLQFHKKKGTLKTDDYSMPHTWINLSFYSSNKRTTGAITFIPRIKVPQEILKKIDSAPLKFPFLTNMKALADDSLPNTMFNYDAYDALVFKVPTNQNKRTYRSLQRTPARKKTTSQSSIQPPPRVNFPRKLSDPDLYLSVEMMSSSLMAGNMNYLGRSPAINIPSRISERKVCSLSFGALNIDGGISDRRTSNNEFLDDMSSSYVSKIGSSGTNSPSDVQSSTGKFPIRTRSLINPFDPSHVTIKLTSNRRRWIHTFPKGPTGNLIQPHHYQVSTANLSDEEELLERLMDDDDNRKHKRNSSYKKGSIPIYEPATSIPIHTTCHRQSTTIEGPVGFPPRGNSPMKIGSYTHGNQASPLPGVTANNGGGSVTAANKHATLLWGATGEQEWNAEITTGVDWKSLTLPACLPLTTDYFPDKLSLHYDYEVAANYSRVPDSVTDIFLELVSQRLTQGFQLIMLPEETVACDSNRNKTSLMLSRVSRQEEDSVKEFKLSIGRVFHHVQWTDSSSIDVTIYRPKHPYAQLERRYKYLFRSPYLSRYEVSSAEFRTERLENYKWNHLDNYVCFKGDPRESQLLEEFKYWTFRLVLIPDVFRTETKILIDADSNSPCDTYHTITFEEQQATVDNFLRFFEQVNRIERPASKKSRTTCDTRERLGSNRMNDRPKHRSGNRTRYESGSKEDSRGIENDEDKEETEFRLFKTMSFVEIVLAMRDPVYGISCISPQKCLPALTFVSADATAWVMKRFEDITSESSAIEYLQRLMDESFIKHISRERLKKFVNGFYFYYFVTGNDKNDYVVTDVELERYEVEVEPCTAYKRPTNQFPSVLCPPFLLPDLPQTKKLWSSYEQNNPSKEMYKDGYIEIDIGRKSDRQEWGHLKYQSKFSPLQCFELELQWMCATGNVVLDLILTWQRRVTNLNLHLFPVPSHPFALPFSVNSNPLRGPIVIPLNMDCLRDKNYEPFSDFPSNTLSTRIHMFQESILRKFGFFSYVRDAEEEMHSRFVHVTGNIIVLIDNNTELEEERPNQPFKNSLHFDYMKSCFLWTFNYMLTKRWKSKSSGEETLGIKILEDFKDFCSNSSHRLRDYWDSFIPVTEPPSSPLSFNENEVFM